MLTTLPRSLLIACGSSSRRKHYTQIRGYPDSSGADTHRESGESPERCKHPWFAEEPLERSKARSSSLGWIAPKRTPESTQNRRVIFLSRMACNILVKCKALLQKRGMTKQNHGRNSCDRGFTAHESAHQRRIQ